MAQSEPSVKTLYNDITPCAKKTLKIIFLGSNAAFESHFPITSEVINGDQWDPESNKLCRLTEST